MKVFDGGVPQLKVKTIQKRRELKEKGRNNLSTTAQRILEAQLKLQAIKAVTEGETAPQSNEELLYFDPETNTTTSSKRSASTSRDPKRQKRDPYYLSPVKEILRKSQDPRLASNEELELYVRENITGDDLAQLNIDSPHFNALPVEVQYRLVSELRYPHLT
jgi:hypothetical protein